MSEGQKGTQLFESPPAFLSAGFSRVRVTFSDGTSLFYMIAGYLSRFLHPRFRTPRANPCTCLCFSVFVGLHPSGWPSVLPPSLLRRPSRRPLRPKTSTFASCRLRRAWRSTARQTTGISPAASSSAATSRTSATKWACGSTPCTTPTIFMCSRGGSTKRP